MNNILNTRFGAIKLTLNTNVKPSRKAIIFHLPQAMSGKDWSEVKQDPNFSAYLDAFLVSNPQADDAPSVKVGDAYKLVSSFQQKILPNMYEIERGDMFNFKGCTFIIEGFKLEVGEVRLLCITLPDGKTPAPIYEIVRVYLIELRKNFTKL